MSREVDGAIRRDYQYYEGYQKGYVEGFNRAVEFLEKEFQTVHMAKPITVKCTPQNGECPILKAKGIEVEG